LKHRIAADELKNLLYDIKNFIFNLIEYPLIILPDSKYVGILKVNQVAGSFGLGKFKYLLQVTYTHLPIIHNQIQNSQPGGIGAGEENLSTQINVEMF